MKQLFEIKAARQMEIYHQELDRLRRAGFTGKEAIREALLRVGRKVKTSRLKRRRFYSQLQWNFGLSSLVGQRYLKLERGEDEKQRNNTGKFEES